MSELQMLFENAKVGDDVLCTRRGWVKIIRINRNSYPIVTSGEYSYTLCGRSSVDGAQSILWPADKVPQYLLDRFPHPKRKIKKTLTRWVNLYNDGVVSRTYLSKEDAELKKIPHKQAIQVKLTGEYEGGRMSKHTPGPWSKKAIATILRYARKNDGLWTEECSEDEFIPDDADARLIAAAPDLLKVLDVLLKLHDSEVFVEDPWDKTMEEARAAIAKATGEV